MQENGFLQETPLGSYAGVWDAFQRLAGVERDSMRPKLAVAVECAKSEIDACCRMGIAAARVPVAFSEGRGLVLPNGAKLEGTSVGDAFEGTAEVVVFVVSLRGFSDFKPQNAKVDFFGDCWGSAYVECAQDRLLQSIEAALAEEGLKRGSVWSPGLAGFDLRNQEALFDILRPERIGCTLTDMMLMHPVKSLSGVMGILPQGAQVKAVPCDFCECRDQCASSDRGRLCHCADTSM